MKKILFRICALLIAIVSIVIVLELFLRLNPKFGYNYSFYKFKHEKSIFVFDNDNIVFIRPSALLGYEVIPNRHFYAHLFSNSYGLIGKGYKLKKETNTFRILLLGDSIATQDCSKEFLEESLNGNALLNSNYKFEVWNAGCPSYDVRRYYLYLKYRGLNYKPDMVLIFLFMNDFALNMNFYYKSQSGIAEYYFPITEISKKYNVNHYFMKHSYLYRFIILRLNNYLLFHKKNSESIDNREENGEYYLQMIKQICKEKEIRLLTIIFPYLKPLNEYKDYQIDQYQTIHAAVKALKINYLNSYEHLSEKNLYKLRRRKEDDIHPSCEVHGLITKIIYDYMLEHYFDKRSVLIK